MIFLNNVALASGNGSFLSQVIVMMLGVFAAAYLLKGDVQTGSVTNVFILAIVIVILNKTLGAILDWFASPINFISLGFFSFIIDAFIIQLAEKFLSKFKVKSFWIAVLMAIIIAIVTVVVEWIF
ncbi:MAG: phage holin family protein [Saprospiraceae bacterium]